MILEELKTMKIEVPTFINRQAESIDAGLTDVLSSKVNMQEIGKLALASSQRMSTQTPKERATDLKAISVRRESIGSFYGLDSGNKNIKTAVVEDNITESGISSYINRLPEKNIEAVKGSIATANMVVIDDSQSKKEE